MRHWTTILTATTVAVLLFVFLMPVIPYRIAVPANNIAPWCAEQYPRVPACPIAGVPMMYSGYESITHALIGVGYHLWTDLGKPVRNSTTSLECSVSQQAVGLKVRVVRDSSGEPIQGLTIAGSPASICNGIATITSIALQAVTNASGWASIPIEGYKISHMYLKFEYLSKSYNFTIPIKTNTTTFRTIHLPSGSVTTD